MADLGVALRQLCRRLLKEATQLGMQLGLDGGVPRLIGQIDRFGGRVKVQACNK